ncbi:MAG TPA: carboxypeptidase regulatory-like domain-containing protein [Bacteroidia bacterium]|jgi:hypothetical protein|nr:carboxypeptidase regulatory-like domain-containing protein [Bacteroidia bacterium]
MKKNLQKRVIKLVKAAILCLLLSTSSLSFAQMTSSSMNGKVTDPKGEVIPGATVFATHVPTGTKYPTTTDGDGVYHLVNLNPGGPYTIKISVIGYTDKLQDNIVLSLGENQRVDYQMNEDTKQLDEVVVTSNVDENKKGTDTRITREQLQTLPTLSRSMTDFSKLTPQSSNNSFAGTNFRYNNITLDGAVSNDAIGFSPSNGGVSGTGNMLSSSTRSNAISLDAIQDMQVSIAPYDVKLGNFTGGSINAVTRRGTNEVEGSVYGFGRNSALTGLDNSGDKSKMPSSYHDYQAGFRIGMPLIKDKLFFFANYENTDRQEPNFYMAGQSGTFMTTAIAQQITDSLKSSTFMPKSQYNPNGGYDPGAYSSYNIFSRSNKGFARLDWNINARHQLNIRNNYVNSEASNLEQSGTQFEFGNYDFVQKNINNSTVAELKSRFTDKTSNSLILGATFVHDYRDPTGTIFPQIQIGGVNGSGTVLLGTNREAGVYNMKQKTYEFTDNFNYYKGKHTFTFGTHNELYHIDYGFINSWNGRFDYSSLANFFNNAPSRMRATYNLGDDSQGNNFNKPVASFNVFMFSLYAQDEIALKDNFKLSLGIRGDISMVPNGPGQGVLSTTAPDNTHYSNTYSNTNISQVNNKIFGQVMPSPRAGFTWDVTKNKKLVVRGGSGIFTGRIPFAWLGYAFYNNGVNYGAFSDKSVPVGTHIPTDPTQFAAFNTNVLKQPNTVEIDKVDNNFHLPQTWRSNLAVDFNLLGGYKLTLEGIYTKTIYDVMFKSINLKDSVKYYAQDVNHVQPVYPSKNGSIDNNLSAAYLMTNTNQGYRYQLTAQLSKQYKCGINFMAAYTYGQSKDMANGIRNSFESNWQLNQATNSNSPQLAYSNFDVRHRIVATAGYRKKWNERFTSYLSFVFTGQSGTPYTWDITANNKLTNSGQQADLFYIPKAQNEIQFTNPNGSALTAAQSQQMWTAFNSYVNSDPYLKSHQGQYTERNGARTPWINQLDMRFMQDIVIKGRNKFQLTFDIVNLTNLINPNWGWQYFVPNTLNSSASIGLTPTGTANNNPTYSFSAPTTKPYSTDKIASRWQGQIGVRYLF